MKLIENIDELQSLISHIKYQHKGFITNFFISYDKQYVYIENKLLFYKKYNNTVFLLLHIHDYFKLYYLTCSYSDLSEALTEFNMPKSIIICELVGKGPMSNEKCIFISNGFNKYSKLIHFVKKMNNFNRTLVFPENMRYACLYDFDGIKSIMNNQFNKYVDINMTDAEIMNYINNKSVVIVEYDKEVAGFTIFNIKSGRVQAIMGGVKNEYKGTYISVILFDYVFRLYDNSKFFSGFVREDNEYLLNYYRKSKYIEDGLYSEILYKECGNKKIEKIIPMN